MFERIELTTNSTIKTFDYKEKINFDCEE